MKRILWLGVFLAAGIVAAPVMAQTQTNASTATFSGFVETFFQQANWRAGARSIPSQYRRRVVAFKGKQRPGSIVVDTKHRYLYFVLENGKAYRYGVGVGRQGFTWKGRATIQRKAEWPGWTPPPAMRKREPWLPAHMPGGPENPLGARALYLYQGGVDTLYRIHGTNQPSTIGQSLSSGCIRMLNEDVEHLYKMVRIGTRVEVL